MGNTFVLSLYHAPEHQYCLEGNTYMCLILWFLCFVPYFCTATQGTLPDHLVLVVGGLAFLNPKNYNTQREGSGQASTQGTAKKTD